MCPYAIGFDIGISSVGWAVVALDRNENPYGIINMGSRIFDAAEQPKTGASLAAPRREARSSRRRLRRHRHRNERIRNLLLNSGVVTCQELASLFGGQLEDIYALRVRALDALVAPSEFARILIHLSQRRGFKSNRKSGNSKEDGELLAAVSNNQKLMSTKGYRTVAEMFLLDDSYRQSKRNKGGQYIATVGRDMVEDEAHRIFAAQRKFGASFATEELENAYITILLSQRSFDEGPGGDSPYGGDQIARMWGKCTFEEGEPRAAKATYSFEYFNLLTKINNIRIIEGGSSVPLTTEQRRTVIVLAHKTDALTYTSLRKALSLEETQRFNMVHYRENEAMEDSEKKEKFSYLKAYHQMRKAFDKLSKGYIEQMPREHRNAIGQILTLYKTGEKIRAKLRDSGLNEQEIEIAESLGSFTKSGHLSVKACDKLIPYMEQGMKYNEACAAAGYDFKTHESEEKSRLLHLTEDDLADITSPVVRRAVSQTVKVLNAIIRERGCQPTYVNVELAREMAQTKDERNKDKKRMDDNHAANERVIKRIQEYGIDNPTGQDIVKMKLWEEQAGICVYSQKSISIERLFEPNYAEVDHIIPYSISFDDSYKNKVLVLAKENRDKGNRLPMQYLTGKRREDFSVWVNANIKSDKKRQQLLKERLTEEDEKKFKERNLQDTKTMSVFLLNYINDRLEFAPSERKKRVTAVNGTVTSHLRKRWGITKIRENGDLHHAVDALVIACTTDGMIQKIRRYTGWKECQYSPLDDGSIAVDPDTGEILSQFPYPWPCFRKELNARLGHNPLQEAVSQRFPAYIDSDFPVRPLFVSRMPRRKVTGAAHKETIKSPAAMENGFVVTKRALSDLKLDKDGEIANYYMPQSDRLLYEALKAQLKAHGGDGKNAFAEPFHKPKSDGTPGPIVNKVKLLEPTTLNVSVHGGLGVADNDSMVRVDVFYVENDGYYFIPIYVADTLKPELPNKACVAFKPYAEWKELKDDEFIFSLYPNDLLRVTHKKALKLTKTQKESTLPDSYETKSEMLYLISANINTAAISCRTHDNSYEIKSMGIKTLEKLEKYTVDVLGNYHKVEKEPRMPFTGKRG